MMTTRDYDIVTIGGGLGGAALATVMSQAGARVLVLEKTTEFKDRVRGEVLVPWGCGEARTLGLYDLLHEACGHELRFWAADLDGMELPARDLVETLPQRLPVMTYYHPVMQDLIWQAAVDAGAEVLRGASVKRVTPGHPVEVTYARDGQEEIVRARLAVGADGRGSAVRKWSGLAAQRAEQRRFFGGVLMDDLPAPENAMHSRFAASEGLMSWLFPQGGGRVRAYIGYHAASSFERLQGQRDIDRFVETSIRLGVPAEYFAKAKPAGPLATFDATDEWVEHPYREGVALIGDAASTGDPTWGQGMSQTLRDVRVLSEALNRSDDWEAAGHAYAEAHDRGAESVRVADTWYTDLFLEIGADADALRQRVIPQVAADMTRIPDTPLSGPDLCPADEGLRRRFFCEDN